MGTVKTLTHGQDIMVNGTFGTVFTVEGYAMQNGNDPDLAMQRAAKLGHELRCGISTGSTITVSRAYYAMLRAKEDAATRLEPGEEVMLDGVRCVVRYKGRYSDFVSFTPVEG